MMFMESKICFALILTLITPLCLEMNYVLALWLGANVPTDTNIFSALVLVDTLICTLNTPCTQVIQATGKIKYYQIASTLVNISLIPVCYIFLKQGFSAVSSFVLTILFSIINQTVCLIYCNKVFSFQLGLYVIKVLIPCIALTCIVPTVASLVRFNMELSAARLLLTCTASVLAAIPACYFLLLNGKERQTVTRYVRTKTSKFLNHGL